MELNLKQTQALDYLEDKVTTEILFGGGAGGGKSILGCYFLTKFALKYDGSRWLMGRASMKTLKETTYVSFLKVAKMQGLAANSDFEVTSAQHKEFPNAIVFPNNSVILMKDLAFYPTDPEYDELGSLEITGGFIDEANQVPVKARDIVGSRMRHNITEYGIVPKLLMSCNPAKNWTYTDFYRPNRDGTMLPYRKFIKSLVDDNPDVDPTYRTNLLKLPKNSKERLLYGNWEYDDDPSTLINYDKIVDLFSNTFVQSGEGFITADIARFGSDKIVIGVWKGWRVSLHSYSKLSITETAELIRNFAVLNNVPISNIVADGDGVGGGAVDILGCRDFVNNSSPLDNPVTKEKENYKNLKSQCYFMLAKKINDAEMFIEQVNSETREMIIAELEQVKQYNMDKDMKKEVLPKDKVKELIGRSPDFSDCLMMRMWFELAPKLSWVAF